MGSGADGKRWAAASVGVRRGWCGNSIAMEGGKGVVVDMRDLFRWGGDGRESSSDQKGGGTKYLAVLRVLFPGSWGHRWWSGTSARGGRHLN